MGQILIKGTKPIDEQCLRRVRRFCETKGLRPPARYVDVADGVAEVENNIRIVEAIEADPQFPPKLKPRVRSLFIDLVNAGIVECMAMARQEQEAHVG